ncbi:MAG TPA: hypothetical protein VFQ68_08715 [Streptosporangiaceae bacterium]|nr:hypothetical protein [Streptosporangiaceae bacterium]
MKRLLLILAAIVATGGIAATPAVAGLAGNPSFSHQIPVPVPSQAQSPRFADDHGRDGTVPAASPSPTRHAEPGDDRGGATRHAEPGDDRGGATGHGEPGDDNGGRHGRG